MVFRNGARILAKASASHDVLVSELQAFIPAGDFITQCLYQPLPTPYAERSTAAGGNVMGVERAEAGHNGVLFLAVAMVKTAEQEAFAPPKIAAWIQAIRDFATNELGESAVHDWTYLNYADKSQRVLESYGVGKIREAARKYDPAEVFQRLCPGGFKISDVKI
ncbi:hypothetical protein B0T26DRAFT_753333 [Lasiosphaeria miniovina]|uniref:Uncharacterized protein n=1 Tax=Lasiosphaeria miniovina TaxID=1954250 RepID=A0AA40DVE8_9PEZI|nr:uncharacterized protein B0T26DRAFT_753333 [Lasiosphaeria miniovina]KAK0713193.1 hypothetical protein B0T26DRAFT_753333 [Lasiosphaeria miniovina]